MATLAELVEAVRGEVGDPVMIEGTANATSTNLVLNDDVNLVQPANAFNGRSCFITDTATAANENKARTIFRSGVGFLEFSLPFPAALVDGDDYGVAHFSDARYARAINEAIAVMDGFVPQKLVEPLAVAASSYRTTPSNPTAVLDVVRIEELLSSGATDYRGLWVWNPHSGQIEWRTQWAQNKALSMHVVRKNAALVTGADVITIADSEHRWVIALSAAFLLKSTTEKEFEAASSGMKSYRRGNVSVTYRDFQEKNDKIMGEVFAELKFRYPGAAVVTAKNRSSLTGSMIRKSPTITTGWSDGHGWWANPILKPLGE